MPTRRAADPNDTLSDTQRSRATIAERIAAFAMLDGMGPATQAQKCLRLSLVGFSAPDIAGLLQTTLPTVHQNLYAERKKHAQPSKPAKRLQ
jgi:DNA-directed RNA polymerase specialized sigma24 family protein